MFIPGNAEESEVVEQIVSGSMPPGDPPLSAAEIQRFVDWINQQEAPDHVVQQEHDEHGDEDDMDDDHDDDEDIDDEHDDMDDDHGDDDEDADADDDHDDDDDN